MQNKTKRKMNALLGAGKYLFAIPFLIFGAFHFMNADAMAGMVPLPPMGAALALFLTGSALGLLLVYLVTALRRPRDA